MPASLVSVVLQVFPPHMFGSGRKGANETPVEGVWLYSQSQGWYGLDLVASDRRKNLKKGLLVLGATSRQANILDLTLTLSDIFSLLLVPSMSYDALSEARTIIGSPVHGVSRGHEASTQLLPLSSSPL
ncbi:hypothetical protein KQX54_016240 [Cotesia glomerata]|uniref:Uncharacterized protein n=1 Tax=Cotesia glomerata TaxID=32391 RepID=A0AAV7IIG6_COTGL|nr:hypothetical protein KQX54_016240 [Cotesia glomerata]